MKRFFLLLVCLFEIVCFVTSQNEFDIKALQQFQSLQSLIFNQEHDKVDSILSILETYPHTEEEEFFLNVARSLNGYNKIKTSQDISVIVPYAEFGKKAFSFLKENINSINDLNEGGIDIWTILSAYAEIYNYLNDSIIVEIGQFAKHYYNISNKQNLYVVFDVIKNTYQYLFSNQKWNDAADMMYSYYELAVEANDSTIRIPIASAFMGAAYLRATNIYEAKKWLTKSYDFFQKFDIRKQSRAYCEMLNDLANISSLECDYKKSYLYASESCAINKEKFGIQSQEYIRALFILAECEIRLNLKTIGGIHLNYILDNIDNISNISTNEKQAYRERIDFLYSQFNIRKNVLYPDSCFIGNAIIIDAIDSDYQGNFSEAISRFRFLLNRYSLYNKYVDIKNVVFAYTSLSKLLIDENLYAEADSILNQSIAYIEKNNTNTDNVRRLFFLKGWLYLNLLNTEMALKWFKKSLDLFNDNEKNSIEYAITLSRISICHKQNGNSELAKQFSDEVYKICKAYDVELSEDSKDDIDRLKLLSLLADYYISENDITKAIDVNKIIMAQMKTSVGA